MLHRLRDGELQGQGPAVREHQYEETQALASGVDLD